MTGYLRRLATTGAAYTSSSVLSKLIAVLLLPLYTAYVAPAEYGAAEVLITGVIAASIVVRLGVIEALLRFYYKGDEVPDQVVRTGFASLFWTTTLGAAIALPFATPISEALLDRTDPELARIAIGGLWVFTLFEYLLALFRLDERAGAFLLFTVANVLVTIPVTVFLVVVEDDGARGLLLGQYATGAVFLVGLAYVHRDRLTLVPDFGLLRRMTRFGLPTMPAELSLYGLNFIDRLLLVRLAGLADAGLYSLSVKFAQAVTVLVKGFQLAWPPLAYSIRDDDEARRVYAVIVTWYVAVCTFVVAGLWLLARWVVRLLAAPEFFSSYEAIGLVSTGVMLYGLYLVLLVVLGRTGRTEFNFPATAAGTVANIALNLVLIPAMGIAGAGLSLVLSYAVILALMYVLTQRLFSVPYEWGRLLQSLGLATVLVAAGELLLPTEGSVGFASRVGVWCIYPLALWATGFPHDDERRAIANLLRPSSVAGRLRSLREATPGEGKVEPDPTGRRPGSPETRSRPSSATRTRSDSRPYRLPRTLHLRQAGVESTFPAPSMARTWNLCLFRFSLRYLIGLAQRPNRAPSSAHWKYPESAERSTIPNLNTAQVLQVLLCGPERSSVLGAVVSTVNERLAAVGSAFVAVSVALTSKLCCPSASSEEVWLCPGPPQAAKTAPSIRHS